MYTFSYIEVNNILKKAMLILCLWISAWVVHLSRLMTKWLCAQRRLRSAWASAQSDQSFRSLLEETLGPQLHIECTAKTLIRLGGFPGWSESWLGAYVILLVLPWGVSFYFLIINFLHYHHYFAVFTSLGYDLEEVENNREMVLLSCSLILLSCFLIFRELLWKVRIL